MKGINFLFLFIYLLQKIIISEEEDEINIIGGKCLFVINYSKVINLHKFE